MEKNLEQQVEQKEDWGEKVKGQEITGCQGSFSYRYRVCRDFV